ncbi:MAG TPA: DNA polymerase III subunit beta [Firmicutes bacterium]|nr:DNA polymerase III subunit beta [Bacillota bacterium]
MNIVCRTVDLLKGLTTVERAVAVRASQPALQGIHMEAREGSLHLTATNLELGIACQVPVTVAAAGVTVVDGRIIGQIVKRLEGETINLELLGPRLLITDGSSTFHLPTYNPEEFPRFPIGDGDEDDIEATITTIKMTQGDLRQAIRRTIFAAATTTLDSRAPLAGVCVDIVDGEISFTATDLIRLSHYRLPLPDRTATDQTAADRTATDRTAAHRTAAHRTAAQRTAAQRRLILPADALLELSRLLAENGGETAMVASANYAIFRFDGTVFFTSLVEGEYVDYQKIIAMTQPSSFRLKREKLLLALERAALVAGRERPVANMRLSGGRLVITAASSEWGEAREEMAVHQEGEDGETVFDARYVIQMLRSVNSNEIVMELGDASRPIRMLPAGATDYIYCVMGVLEKAESRDGN